MTYIVGLNTESSRVIIQKEVTIKERFLFRITDGEFRRLNGLLRNILRGESPARK